MKSVIFTEEQLKNLNEIGNELFADEQDPRSPFYVRKLNRPRINWFGVVIYLFAPLFISILLYFILNQLDFKTVFVIVSEAIALTLYFILTLKKAIICAVKIYQRFAPDSLRNKCRFEPSCSEYMILAVEKYGVIKGVLKGIDRLKRCNVNGGGFDYP